MAFRRRRFGGRRRFGRGRVRRGRRGGVRLRRLRIGYRM